MSRVDVAIVLGCLLGTGLLNGCSDEVQGGVPMGQGGTTAGGTSTAGMSNGAAPSGGNGPVGSRPCSSVCCPESAACFSDPAAGKTSAGAECAATLDNTASEHIQLRQQWIRATTPAGNRIRDIYAVLAGRTQLPWKECKQSGDVGSGGHIQLLEYFLPGGESNMAAHYSLQGYSRFVPESAVPAVVAEGLCFGEEDFAGDAEYALAGNELSPSGDYPRGLPAPMGLKDGPWHVAPARAKRLENDFNLSVERVALLARIEDEFKPQGFDAVFYYDPATGYAHGYAPLSWTIVYTADGSEHIAIPIREAETKVHFNDPAHPNCVGGYRNTTISACTAGSQTDPPWGCADDGCAAGESPATTGGYFLITELEQIYAEIGSTLCVSYPLREEMQKEGFYNEALRSCRSEKWDPTKADQSGLPRGDWCAATNAQATDFCHDAWKNLSYHVYAGAKLKTDATCPL